MDTQVSPEPTFGKREAYILNTSAGWLELYRRTGCFNGESGLFVVNSSHTEMASLVGAAQVAMRFGLYNHEHEARFEKISLLFPPGQIADQLRSEVANAIQSSMQAEGASALSMTLAPLMFETSALITLQSATLVEEVRKLRPKTACTIILADLFRYSELNVSTVLTRRTDLRETTSRHLERLVRELSEVAIENGLTVLLFCDTSRAGDPDFQVAEADNFGFLEITSVSVPMKPQTDMTVFIEAFRKGGWAEIKTHPEYCNDLAEPIAIQLSEHFGTTGEIALAWKAIEPQAQQPDRFTAATRLSMAGGAHAAGDWEVSLRLLKSAVSEGLQAAEELYAALSLAGSFREEELFVDLLSQLRRTYPEEVLTARAGYLDLFNKRDFAGALKVAEELNLPIEVAQCRAFLSPVIDAREFLREMESLGDLEQGLMSCAEEALFRRHGCHAIVWARLIPERHPLFERACIVRLQALRICVSKGATIFCTKELEAMMRFIAGRPNDSKVRLELERLLEFGIEEPLAKVLLSTVLVVAIEQQARRDDESIKAARSLHDSFDSSTGGKTEDDFVRFMEGFQRTIEESPERNIHIGQGKIHESVLPLVGPKLIWEFAQALVNTDARHDLETATIWMHAICLACNSIGDPDTDFTVLQSVIEVQATLGAAQGARDLAETALRLWPQSQPRFLSWRISQGWAALAEACLRSNNSLAAVRYLCLSLLAHEAPAFDVELLRRWYRMAARIFRDLQLAPAALRCIGLEKELMSKVSSSASSVSLDVLELQIALPVIMNSSTADQLKALERSEELLRLGETSEFYPLTAIQASILRVLPAADVPPAIQRNFEERLKALPGALQHTLRAATNPKPTIAEITALFEGLPDAQDHQYLAYQIRFRAARGCNCTPFRVGVRRYRTLLGGSRGLRAAELGSPIGRADGTSGTAEKAINPSNYDTRRSTEWHFGNNKALFVHALSHNFHPTDARLFRRGRMCSCYFW